MGRTIPNSSEMLHTASSTPATADLLMDACRMTYRYFDQTPVSWKVSLMFPPLTSPARAGCHVIEPEAPARAADTHVGYGMITAVEMELVLEMVTSAEAGGKLRQGREPSDRKDGPGGAT